MFDLDYDLTKYRSVMVFYWEMFGDLVHGNFWL